LLQPISCFFLGNRTGPGAFTEILLRATKETTEEKTEQQVYKQGKEEKRGVRKQKKKQKNQSNYTTCSRHDSIAGKYFFALQKSKPKVLLKISKQRILLAGIPLKMASFLTAQMLQPISCSLSTRSEVLVRSKKK